MKVEKIQYVKCHTMGRFLCERRNFSALRYRFRYCVETDSYNYYSISLCAVFLLPDIESVGHQGAAAGWEADIRLTNLRYFYFIYALCKMRGDQNNGIQN